MIREVFTDTAVINGQRYPITYNQKGQIFFRENNYYSAKIIEAVTGLRILGRFGKILNILDSQSGLIARRIF